MPIYEIEQYEIHTMKYRVEASSEAVGIKMLFDGEADAVEHGLEVDGAHHAEWESTPFHFHGFGFDDEEPKGVIGT